MHACHLETVARPEMASCVLGNSVDNQVCTCTAPFTAATSSFPKGQFMVWFSTCEAADGAEPVQQEACFSSSGSHRQWTAAAASLAKLSGRVLLALMDPNRNLLTPCVILQCIFVSGNGGTII